MITPNTDTLYEIYTGSNETFTVGQIMSENEFCLLFKVFDELGREYSLNLIRRNAIITLDSNTDYLKKVAMYIEYWKDKAIQKISDILNPVNICELNISRILSSIANTGQIATIITNSDTEVLTGFISSCYNSFIILDCVSEIDATIFKSKKILMNDIILIEFNCIDNDVLLYAYNKLNT